VSRTESECMGSAGAGRLALEVTEGSEAAAAMRVLLADDHAGYREGVARLITDTPGLTLVGLAADGAEALAMILALQPDIALLDVRMPGFSGIEVCRRLAASGDATRTRVVLITGTPDPVLSAQAADAGAAALISKETPPLEICSLLLAGWPAGT
jgi:two-component system, NarL family, response regulator DesR